MVRLQTGGQFSLEQNHKTKKKQNQNQILPTKNIDIIAEVEFDYILNETNGYLDTQL